MTHDRLSVFYVPFPNLKEAIQASKTLLDHKVIACANIIPGVLSVYQEEGAFKETPEAIVIFKTHPRQQAAFKDQLTQLHPYATPAIVELAVGSGTTDVFCDWVDAAIAP